MSEFQIIALTGLVIYLLVLIGVGFFSQRNESADGFIIGSRNVGYIPTFGSLSASFRDGAGIVLWVGFGVAGGYFGLWLILGVIIGLAVYALVAPPVRKIAADHDFITIGEMLRHFLGPVTEKFSALIVVIFTLAYIALQLNVSGTLFAEIVGLDGWIAISTIALVIAVYMFMGGYSTVIKTDAIQFFIILSVIAVPLFLLPAKEDVLNFQTLFELGWKDNLAFFMIGFCFVLSSSDSWQRVFSAKSYKVIRVAFPLAGVFLMIMTLALIFVGMGAKNNLTDVEQSQALFEIFRQQALPTYIMAFLAIAIMSITMSTLDTMCYLFTASLSKNFMPEHFTNTRPKYVRFSQIIIVMVLITMSMVALTIEDVIQYIFDAVSLLFILVPTYVFCAMGLYHKSRRLDMLITLSLFASAACYIVMFLRGDFEDMLYMFVPFALSSLLHIVCILGYKNLSKHA